MQTITIGPYINVLCMREQHCFNVVTMGVLTKLTGHINILQHVALLSKQFVKTPYK